MIAYAICADTCETSIPGTWDKCSECALEVYIANSTRRQAEIQEAELCILCFECGASMMKQQEDLKVAPLTEVQRQELLEEIKRHR